jgi:hypothetical protein
MVKDKLRPKRIFKNKKGYYFKVNGKRKYIKFDEKKISDKQLLNINIKNVFGYVNRKPKGAKRTRKPKTKVEDEGRDLTKIKTIPVIPIDKVKTEVSAVGTNIVGQNKPSYQGYTLGDLTDLVFSKKVVPELTIEGSIKREDKEKLKKDYEEKIRLLVESSLGNDTSTIKGLLSKNLGDISTEDVRKLVKKLDTKERFRPLTDGGVEEGKPDDIPSMIGEEDEEEKEESGSARSPTAGEEDDKLSDLITEAGREGEFLVGRKKQSTLTPNVINSLLEDSGFTRKRGVRRNVSQYTPDDWKELGQILVKIETPEKLKKEYLTALGELTKEGRSNSQIQRDYKKIKDIVVEMYNKKIGKGLGESDGLWNTEIDQIFKDKLPEKIIPVISNDEMPTLLKYINKDTDRFGFVINSDDSDSQGSHWKAVFISRPDASVEVYDSLVSIPNEKFIKDLFKVVDAFKDDVMYKLKINTVRDQSEQSSNCGHFAVNFLINRFKGKKFKNASLFDKVDKSGEGEKDIKKFKSFL